MFVCVHVSRQVSIVYGVCRYAAAADNDDDVSKGHWHCDELKKRWHCDFSTTTKAAHSQALWWIIPELYVNYMVNSSIVMKYSSRCEKVHQLLTLWQSTGTSHPPDHFLLYELFLHLSFQALKINLWSCRFSASKITSRFHKKIWWEVFWNGIGCLAEQPDSLCQRLLGKDRNCRLSAALCWIISFLGNEDE